MSIVSKEEFLAQIDVETMKAERMEYAQKINELYDALVPVMAPYGDKLNGNSSAKYIFEYLLVVFGYAKEIATLQLLNWNNSIQGITRNLLECYAYAKKLIQLYGTADYDDYVLNLIVIDMEQDRKIYNSLVSDTTIQDTTRRDFDANSYVSRFQSLIAQHFTNRTSEIIEADKIVSIMRIIKDLKREYDGKYPENKDKSVLISYAINSNNLISSYEDASTVYKLLCHYTHNTISSL